MKKNNLSYTNKLPLRKTKIRHSPSDRVFYIVVTILLTLFTLVVLLPLVHIVAASFSKPEKVLAGKVLFWPVDFSLEGYKAVFRYKDIWIGYKNTIIYTTIGTAINLAVTMAAAYALSRKELPFRNFIMFLFAFTMFFGGGLIPTYINIKNLKLINTMWALILPGAMSVYNMIIARTFLQTNIPNELFESAQLDGCSYSRFFFQIVLPLSKALLAVLALYYAVGHWNSYFNALIYISDKHKKPLQIFLREVLVVNTIDNSMLIDPELQEIKRGISELLKYSLIIVSNIPILCAYPFIQKYFVKGVMIGSLKG